LKVCAKTVHPFPRLRVASNTSTLRHNRRLLFDAFRSALRSAHRAAKPER
jgi:hypothetical protein